MNQVDNPVLPGRVSLEIQNQDAAANLFCNPNSGAVSTTNGRKIAPGNSWILSFADNFATPSLSITSSPVHIYCVNDGAAGTTKVAVTQAY